MTRREFLGTMFAGMAGYAVGCARGQAETSAPVSAPEPHGLREALFYERLSGNAVRCGICPRACVVPDGGRGRCRVRANKAGRYYSLVYGRPCTTHVDPIEKKPFFHVYPGAMAYSLATVGCNIECKFCQNWDISQASPEDFPVPYAAPSAVAAAAKASGSKVIAYTYSEPTVFYEYMSECAAAGLEAGVESVVVSNGFIAPAPMKALLPRLRAVKIDLKSFTESFYADVCDGMLKPVLDTLKLLAAAGVWFEIVVLLIPSLNDSEDEVRRMSGWIVKELGPDVPLHFSRYHPMYKMKNIPATPAETLARARRAAMAEGCRFVYIGNLPGDEGANTYCPSCKALLVSRYQYRVSIKSLAGDKCGKCGAAVPGVWQASATS